MSVRKRVMILWTVKEEEGKNSHLGVDKHEGTSVQLGEHYFAKSIGYNESIPPNPG